MKTQKFNQLIIHKLILSLVFIFLIQLSVLNAQNNELKITRFNASDGLADNSIYCILQDWQGFLWLGTRNGLHKYDGYSFTVYINDLNDSTTIANNFIYNFYEDKDKNLWIGSKFFLSLYMRDSDSFKNFEVLPNDGGVESITSITEDKQGRIWVSVRNRGLFIFNRDTDKFTPAWDMFG